jgi:hypothetical protein
MNPSRLWPYQLTAAAAFVVIVGGLAVHNGFNPAPDDIQAATDIGFHPFALAFGCLLPSLVLSPLVYWSSGWIIRRSLVRTKACKHCASNIPASASVCRYCQRDVAPIAPTP